MSVTEEIAEMFRDLEGMAERRWVATQARNLQATNPPPDLADRFLNAALRQAVVRECEVAHNRKRQLSCAAPQVVRASGTPGKALSDEVRNSIRALSRVGVPQREIAARLNVSRFAIRTVLSNKKPGPRKKRPRWSNGRFPKTLMKNIEAWEREARHICIGRQAKSEHWLEIMTSPNGDDEVEARTDFLYFLCYCRDIPMWKAAQLLGLKAPQVKALLKDRKR